MVESAAQSPAKSSESIKIFVEKDSTLGDRLNHGHNRNCQHSVVSVDWHGPILKIHAQPGERLATTVAS